MHKLKNKSEIELRIDSLVEKLTKQTDATLIEVYEEQIKKLVNQRELIVDSPQSQFTTEQFRTALSLVLQTLKNPVAMWRNEEYECKTTILRMYFPNKLRYDLNDGFRTADLDPSIELINSLDPSKIQDVEMPGVEPGSAKAQ